jgi:branched-chain amino acid transport system permease protein
MRCVRWQVGKEGTEMAPVVETLEASEKLLIDRFDHYVRDRVRLLVNEKVIEEYRSNPRGPHSDELSRILNYFRRGTIRRKYALYARKPFKEYQIIQLSGLRSKVPTGFDGRIFDSQADADFEIFMLRIADLMQDEGGEAKR